jgi:hypothetical protein
MKVRRLPLVDEYVEDGEAAVFVNGRVVVLSPLATHLLGLVADDWTDLAPLSEFLVAAFGAPPAGRSATHTTAEALRTLAAEGLVEIADAINESVPNYTI